MYRFLGALLVALALVVSGASALVVDIDPAAAQVTPLDDEPDDAPGLGSIIGSPEAGPKPEDAGDRGGYAQLGLALLMATGIAFIGWRVIREARRGQSNISPGGSL